MFALRIHSGGKNDQSLSHQRNVPTSGKFRDSISINPLMSLLRVSRQPRCRGLVKAKQ